MTRFNYKLISTYRTQLMGLAILWVMLYHSTVNLSSVPVLGTLQAYGYGGVDMFLLVSGLGLYYAYRTNVNKAAFYRRRLQRILPAYLPVVLIFCTLHWGMGEMLLVDVLLNVTTLSFWLGLDSRFDWYVPALLVLYLLTPLFMHYFKVHGKVSTVAVTSLIALLCSVVLSGTPLAYLLIFTIRIPIFLAGVLAGYLIDKKQPVSRLNGVLFLGMLLSGVALLAASQKYMSGYMWSHGLWWYPFILITLPLCLLLAGGLHWMAEQEWTRYPLLSFCGTHSLELYLIHERVLKLAADLRRNLELQMGDLVLNVLSILLTLGLAILLKKAVNGLSARMKSGRTMTPQETA